MRGRKLISAILCVSLIASSLTGCGWKSKEQAEETKETQNLVLNTPLSDEVNEADDSKVNYETNFVSGATVEEEEQAESVKKAVTKDESDKSDDLVVSLIEQNKNQKTEEEQDAAISKDPEDPRDEEGNLQVPFDQAYPDIFNSEDVQYADNAILVKVKNAYSDKTVDGLKKAGIGKMETIFEVGENTWYTAYLLKGTDVNASMESVRKVSGVVTAEYNFKYETSLAEDEAAADAVVNHNPKYGDQWPREKFGILKAWHKYQEKHKEDEGKNSTIVAVIDTGVDYTHKDLKSNMWLNKGEIPDNGVDDDGNGYVDDYYGIDMTTRSGSGMDDNGHGTHVAGIIGASNNKEGIVGYAYNTKIMTIKAGDASGYFLQDNIAKAILYAYDNGADVINMSFGGIESSIAVQDALAVAYSRCVLVASAGNNGAYNEGLFAIPNYPAAFSYVLGVMSVDETVTESSFTNYDVNLYNSIEYEVYAPGEQIISTLPGDKYGRLSGTSMAAPVVAAQAALLRSCYPDRDTYPTKFIYGQIVGTADMEVACLDPKIHGLHNIPGVINFYDSVNELPVPDIGMSDYTIFDTAGFKAAPDKITAESKEVNNGDGVVDAGEIIALGMTLKNRWGMSKNTKVSIDAISMGGVEHPYVEILNNDIDYKSIGTYSENDSGKLYTEDGEMWNGWENPFYIKISKDCPNDYTATLNVTVTYENGLDESDKKVYTTTDTILLKIRRGTILPNKIEEDTTLTKDNYYIIPNSMIVMEGATLTIEEGTKVQFWCSDPEDSYADTAITYMKVAGKLICKGTEAEPVEMFPSEWMGNYRVEIFTAGSGYASMEHTKVVNPYLEINKAVNCEFTQNYKLDLNYRRLANGKIYENSSNAEIIIQDCQDSAFYKVGGHWNPLYLAGIFERCIFVDSRIRYGEEWNNNFTATNCVFYGNNNYWDDETKYEGGPSNLVIGGTGNDLTVSALYRNEDTGRTYMEVYGPVNEGTAQRFAKLLGGDLAVFDNKEELTYVMNRMKSASVRCGLYKQEDGLYNHNGTKVEIDEEVVKYDPEHNQMCLKSQDKDGSSYIIFSGGNTEQSSFLFEIPGTIYITDILLEDYVINLDMEETAQIDATVSPKTADLDTLIYESQDESIVTVDKSGKIMPVAIGTTEIKIYAPDYAVYNYVTVNVQELIELEKIAVKENDITMDIDTTKKLKVEFTPAATTKKNVSYVSSDEAVVSVDKRGVLTAHAEGKAVITITGHNGISATAQVRVVIPAAKLEFVEDAYVTTLEKEDGTSFYPVITPENATNQKLTWASSNPEICYVDEEGSLVKLKDGTAILKASLEGTALSDTLTVSVIEEEITTDVVNMKSSSDKIYALMSDGTLWSWGGDITKFYPEKVLWNDKIKDFMIYESRLYILNKDGEVWEVYDNQTGTKILSNIKALPDDNRSCNSFFAIAEDGGVWAWGDNSDGQLGDGTRVDRYEPVQVAIDENVKKIVRNYNCTIFLTDNNRVYVVGGSGYTIPECIRKDADDIRNYSDWNVTIVTGDVGELYYIESSSIEERGKVNMINSSHFWTVDHEIHISNGHVYVRNRLELTTGGGYTLNGYEFGNDDSGFTEISGIDNAEKVFSINRNIYIQTTDGKFYAAGYGNSYALANGSIKDSKEPVRVYFGIEKNEEPLSYSGWQQSEDGTSIIIDYNQALSTGSQYGIISLKDSEGTPLLFNKTMNLDKLIIKPKAGFVDGETYTLTIPQNALMDRTGTYNSEEDITFTYHKEGMDIEGEVPDDEILEDEVEEPVIHESVKDEEKLSERHKWTKEEVQEYWNKFVADGYNTRFYSNVILNRLNDDDVSTWLRFTGREGDESTVVGIGGNYWGTTNEDLINKQILDFDDYQSLVDLNEGAILTEAPEDTYPFVVSAYLELDGKKVDTVGNDLVTFVVEFNRDMDTDIDLSVKFGSHYPYADYEVSGEYESPRVWKGTMKLSTLIENGYQYWSVSNGKAAGTALKLYTDWGRFPFKIDTSSAQALIMQAEADDNGIHLTWEQDDFTTLAGYNVYRSTIEDGQYTKINRTVIPADTKEWFDDTVEPGQKYYYNFTVVESDMTESEPSGKVVVTAKDTMAPSIYHSPVYHAFTGSNLVISATVTDNVAIKEATLFYRITGTEEWKPKKMTNNNDKYSAIIPAADITVEGLEYYIDATDGIAHTYKGTADDPYSIMVQVAVSDNDKGDIDGNGAIELADALMLLMAVNDRLNLTEEQFARADLWEDGVLEAREALRIIQYVNGTITSVLP